MSIKDRIISGIKSSLYDKLLGNSKKKTQGYIQGFRKKLEEFRIDVSLIEKLSKTYSSNLDAVSLNGKDETDENAINIMYLTIYSHCESIVSEKFFSYKKLVVFGQPGCGKTSFICSYIKKNKITKVCYAADNEESLDLLKANSDSLLEIENDSNFFVNSKDALIMETSKIDKILDLLSREENVKIVVLIDSQSVLGTLYNISLDIALLEKRKAKIEGLVITKKDFIGSLSALMSCNSVLNYKILSLTQYEITDVKRSICSPYDIMELVSLKMFNKREGIEDIRGILSKNADLINLKTYRVYVSFMLSMDAEKYDKVFNMFNFVFKKLNVDVNAYKTLLEKLKNEKQHAELTNGLKKHLIIIDSMRNNEKLDYSLIDVKRAKRIAAGCGVSLGDVFNMLNKFEQTKKAIKFMNYSKLFEDK